MIKQMQMKRELITAKSEMKIVNLQEKMASYEKGHLTNIQPVIEPAKFGKRMGLESITVDNTDLLAHEGFDRVLERKYEIEYPDYYNNASSRLSSNAY